MAGEREIRCVGPSYWLRDSKTAVQRAVNWYMMPVEGLGEDAPVVLEGAPGLALFADLGMGDIRGAYNADGRMFVVAASSLVEVRTDGTFTTRGALGTSTGNVSMVNGTGQLALVDGPFLYVYNLDTGAFTTVASDGWRGSNRVDFIDGVFVFADPDTEQFYISAIDDATDLDALDFSSADSQPDNVVAHIVRKREVYFFGSRSCEVWINSGAEDFPLTRYQGTPIDVGIVGPWAVTRANDTLIWVGQTENGGPHVYAMVGYQPVRVSDQFAEQQLLAADYANAKCISYKDAGGEFVLIDAPGLQTTLVYDVATKQWHERGRLDIYGAWTPSDVSALCYFNGKTYAAVGGALYHMSREYADLAGVPMVMERTWPHLLTPSLEPLTHRSLELRCTTGTATQGYVTLELSNDGGGVFGPPRRASLGAEGARQQRVRWFGLGTCRAGGSRVYRIRCADPVRLTIQGAALA